VQAMKVVNELLPSTPEQIQAMQEPGPNGPIYMVNLLKFRDKAEYEDGRESDLSGRAAYQLYGLGVMQLLPKYGGKLVFVGDVTGLQIGKVEELWDEVVIAMYPDRAALLAMSTSKEWRDLSVHRAAGLAGQLNIETVAPAAARARR
jgi:uncharacterized protein (DUF1330 family)